MYFTLDGKKNPVISNTRGASPHSPPNRVHAGRMGQDRSHCPEMGAGRYGNMVPVSLLAPFKLHFKIPVFYHAKRSFLKEVLIFLQFEKKKLFSPTKNI